MLASTGIRLYASKGDSQGDYFSTVTVSSLTASHRRLIRRRILSFCSALSPLRQMRKKKPKNSLASKSSPKGSPPAKSTPPKSVAKDLVIYSSPTVLDAQIGSDADMVAQQSIGVSDLVAKNSIHSSDKTVVVNYSTGPSSSDETSPSVPESSSTPSPSDAVPIELEVSEDKAASSTPVKVVTAVAKDTSSSSQVAVVTERLKTPTVVEISGNVAGEVVGAAPPVLGKEGQDKTVKITTPPPDTWCTHAKGLGTKLFLKGEAFTLPSGEACIRIPNSVIKKNRKSWEPFVIGQFYSDPPTKGTLHNIVNGIWSKHYRDIAVSKMEGFAFLFRIPNAATRNMVIYQRLWQIEGQTIFVDKWEPGVVPVKPELTSAPIWLELRNVPF